jgi:hypothetical protein
MPKDYAKRSNVKRVSRKKSKKHGWKFWGIIILIIGLLSFAVFNRLYSHFGHKNLIMKSKLVATKALHTAHIDNAVTTPELDFYTILPKEKVKINPSDLYATGRFSLLIGTAPTEGSAEHIKTNLALLGFNATAYKEGDIFKVKVGPYKTEDLALADQKRLADNHIKSTLIKK